MEDKQLEWRIEDEKLEWKRQEELLKQVVRVEGSCGDYSILRLSDGRYFVFDRTNLKFLLPSSGSLYTLPNDWKQWMKRGFIVISFPTRSNDTEYYIFSVPDKRFIAKGTVVEPYEFLKGKSDYFIVRNEDWKCAIFDKNGKQIFNWSGLIQSDGLVNGESDYYMAIKNDKGAIKGAIFHKSGKQISDWFDDIEPDGLVKGESDYYVAEKDLGYPNRLRAIFHKSGKQISGWFDWIYPLGLVEGKSEYYMVMNNGKKAIFHEDGRQISQWFDGIEPEGLVYGQSEYYVGEEDDLYYICKLGSIKVVGPFKKIMNFGFIEDPSQNRISIMTLTDQQKTLTKQEIDNFFKENEVEDER